MGHDITIGYMKAYITGGYSKLEPFLFTIYDFHRNTSDVVAIMCYCNIKWLEKYWGLQPCFKSFPIKMEYYDYSWREQVLSQRQIPYDKTNSSYWWGCEKDGTVLPFGIFLESYYNQMVNFLLLCLQDKKSTWYSDQGYNLNTIKSSEQLAKVIKSRQENCIAHAYVYSYLHHPDGKYTMKCLQRK